MNFVSSYTTPGFATGSGRRPVRCNPHQVSHGVACQVLLVAGDTFRAAAAEQLAGWAERSSAQLISASSPKQRPDSLMYTAVEQASPHTNLLDCSFVRQKEFR